MSKIIAGDLVWSRPQVMVSRGFENSGGPHFAEWPHFRMKKQMKLFKVFEKLNSLFLIIFYCYKISWTKNRIKSIRHHNSLVKSAWGKRKRRSVYDSTSLIDVLSQIKPKHDFLHKKHQQVLLKCQPRNFKTPSPHNVNPEESFYTVFYNLFLNILLTKITLIRRDTLLPIYEMREEIIFCSKRVQYNNSIINI